MTKSIFAVIAGRPNAGKSTLMNRLIGEKVAIVSDKPQTTRTRIYGVLTRGETQFVFIDTPGIHQGKTRLSQHMTRSIFESVKDAEMVIVMADCTRKISKVELDLIERLKKSEQPAILILNKVDLMKDKTGLFKVIEAYNALYPFKEIIPVSALKGISTDTLLPILEKYAVESPHFFAADQSTDQSERTWIAEIVREKILRLMHEEIPHGIAVEVEQLEQRKNRDKDILDISVVIVSEKSSHKGMIIGKQGAMLKRIATLAREELEEFYGVTVNLQCYVKIKENWRNQDSFIKDMGLGSE